jgi:voltage-gated potassium channel
MKSVSTPTKPAALLPVGCLSLQWLRRHPVAAFLTGLVLAIASFPFDEQFRDGELAETLRLTVVLVAGLFALGDRRRTLVWGMVFLTPALAGKWLNHFRPDLVPAWIFLAPALLFFMFVVMHLLRFILRAPRVDSEVLCAGVAGYLMLGLLWSAAYALVGRLAPDSFAFTVGPAGSQSMKGFTALYYSCITLTTVGYGDIVPMSGGARMLAMMEAMTGTFYVAVLISRLVAVYSSAQPSAPVEGPRTPG